MLLRDRPLLRALLVLVAVYGLLSLPWPGLGRAICGTYAEGAEAVMADILPFEGTTFSAGAEGQPADEWNLVIRFPPAPGATSIRGVRVHVRRIFYTPLAFLTAVALAFPSRGRRAWFSACGSVAVLGLLQIPAVMSVFTTRGLLDLGRLPNLLVTVASRALFEAPGMAFAVPALLWGTLARPLRDGWDLLWPSPPSRPGASAPLD